MAVLDFSQTLIKEGDVTYISAASGSITDADRYYIGTYSGQQTLTLPSAVGRIGQRFYVKKEVGASGPLTVTSAGGTIDGATSEAISVGAGFRQFVSDGANWRIFGGTILPVVYQMANVGSGGTISIDASLASVYRVTCAASATLAVPQANTAIDGDTLEVEILCTAAGTITVTTTGTAPNVILLTGASGATIAVPAGKRCFMQLRFTAGVGWFLRGQSVQA